MSTGVCVGYREESGYGFIRPDEGGADIFVHARELTNADILKQGQRCTFEIVMDDRRGKPRAEKVRVV